MKKAVLICVNIVLFILAVVLVCIGQSMIGYLGLGLMVLGLAIILSLLYCYNRKYR